eukprot:12339601-Alexandrium_andersonii.AAC.1
MTAVLLCDVAVAQHPGDEDAGLAAVVHVRRGEIQPIGSLAFSAPGCADRGAGLGRRRPCRGSSGRPLGRGLTPADTPCGPGRSLSLIHISEPTRLALI